jgi:hypothetical protein
VSHPFLDLLDIYDEEDMAVHVRLCDAYLTAWWDCAPTDQLQTLWRLAHPLCYLHQAVSYQGIMTGVETSARGDFAGTVPHYIRKVLSAVRSSGVS